jgi:hypothetical protein
MSGPGDPDARETRVGPYVASRGGVLRISRGSGSSISIIVTRWALRIAGPVGCMSAGGMKHRGQSQTQDIVILLFYYFTITTP